ncbi:MAG TPA: thiamine phosphate synthase [Rickettsiales bacterium]|nr:thiamine phosphate synthase [Rickettsiales bacterium]
MSDCHLYLVSPPRLQLEGFLPQLEAALATEAVKAFQLRLKEADDQEILNAAREIVPLCREYDIAFILNDRADLAVQCGADGVHLGQEDMTVADARKILGDEGVIGVSCHASKDMGIRAAEEGADYVAFGAFFPTKSKPQEKVEKWGIPTPEIIEWWSTYTTIPCVAIGGMKPENCGPLVTAGADFIAAITSVWEHPQGAAEAVREFEQAIAKAKA